MNRGLASRLLVVACTLCVTAPHLFAQTGTEADASRAAGQSRRTTLRTGPVAVPQAVTAAAARDGRVRIIIGLSVAFAPEGLLPAAERVRQRNDIAAAQNALEAALPALRLKKTKRFRIIPAMAAEVDAAALPALARRLEVDYLELDELAAPTLAESAAVIGAPSVWAAGYTGTGQAVAILDTGIDRTHSFFGGRVVSEACYSTTDPGYSTSVCGATTGTGSAAPCSAGGCDHGTHVAGIAAGSGASFSGVAPAANIIAIQVFSDFGSRGPLSYTSDQMQGLQRVYDLRSSFSIAAVNMSLGGGRYFTQAECDGANTARKAIIDSLRSVGIATVISSGNNAYLDSLSSPGCISTAISVGSTNDGSSGTTVDQVASSSNSASFLNLLAPGRFITSSVPGGGFATYSGTSMAAPQVAGAWTLLKSRFPTASVTDVLNALVSAGAGILDSRNGLIKPRINVNLAMSALSPAGCTFTISPVSITLSAGAAAGTVGVTTQAGCAWTAASNASFIGISSGAAGTGSGTVAYDVGANAGPQRVGTVTVAAQTLTVTQAAGTPGAGVTSDLNGDGWLDLLWHHQTDGRIVAWSMDGINRVSESLLTPSQVPDTTWKIVGAGDLDADGSLDLVWQNIADGRVSAWLMNGLTLREGTLLSIPQVPDTQWKIRSVADLDGDGRADLFWQHEGTGEIAVWLMNGLRVVNATLLSPAQVSDLDWKLVGTGDFDGNGKRDLVWHHQGDGRIAVWFMNGLSQVSGSLINPGQVANLTWKVRGVGDLNGDGRPDLLWQNTADGSLAVWYMNGLNLVEGTPLNPSRMLDTNWHIVGPR